LPYTSWAAEISFGWEYEGKNLQVLRWYRPERFPDPPWSVYDGNKLNQAWSSLSQLNKEEKYRQLKQRGLTWADYVKLPDAPAFVADYLKQEIWDPTFEILNKAGSFPNSVDSLFTQLNQVRNFLSQDTARDARGFQVHIVFARPPRGATNYNSQLAALYQLLNDYAFAKRFRKEDEKFRAFNGLNVLPIETVNYSLSKNLALGVDHKYRYVGFRDLYGNNKIGFEIRDGWRTNWNNFRSLIERVVMTLTTLDNSISIKRRRATGAIDFNLLQHYDFRQNRKPTLPTDLYNHLKTEADYVLSKLSRHYRELQPDDALLESWLMAFTPWEDHPAIAGVPGMLTTVTTQRAAMEGQLRRYFEGTPPPSGPKPRDNTHYVTDLVKTFLNKTGLYRYL
jgi:hypothetical protein